MDDSEDRTEELPTRPGSSEPTTADDDDPTVPGRRTEPRRGREEPVQEYPGQGVRSHDPTDPVTGRGRESAGPGSDGSAGDGGIRGSFSIQEESR